MVLGCNYKTKGKEKKRKKKGVQGGGEGLYRLLDMHGRFQKVLEGSGKLQCMRDSMRFHQVPSSFKRFYQFLADSGWFQRVLLGSKKVLKGLG